jgi:hypothetical protein
MFEVGTVRHNGNVGFGTRCQPLHHVRAAFDDGMRSLPFFAPCFIVFCGVTGKCRTRYIVLVGSNGNSLVRSAESFIHSRSAGYKPMIALVSQINLVAKEGLTQRTQSQSHLASYHKWVQIHR